MVGRGMTGSQAGYLCFVYGPGEVFLLAVSQKSQQITGKPEFFVVDLMGVILEFLLQLYDDVAFHNITPPVWR
jgi:hypothetical protein